MGKQNFLVSRRRVRPSEGERESRGGAREGEVGKDRVVVVTQGELEIVSAHSWPFKLISPLQVDNCAIVGSRKGYARTYLNTIM